MIQKDSGPQCEREHTLAFARPGTDFNVLAWEKEGRNSELGLQKYTVGCLGTFYLGT